MLFLSRDEGGQGLVHLASRIATFRLQFIQKYLTGPEDLVWRVVASCILRRVNNLSLEGAPFLTDLKFLKLGVLPPFYQGVFKSWARKQAWSFFFNPVLCFGILKCFFICIS